MRNSTPGTCESERTRDAAEHHRADERRRNLPARRAELLRRPEADREHHEQMIPAEQGMREAGREPAAAMTGMRLGEEGSREQGEACEKRFDGLLSHNGPEPFVWFVLRQVPVVHSDRRRGCFGDAATDREIRHCCPRWLRGEIMTPANSGKNFSVTNKKRDALAPVSGDCCSICGSLEHPS
jgi:hypothetical protein